MRPYKKIASSGNMVVQMDLSLGDDFSDIIRNLELKPSVNTVTTIRNTSRFKGLTVNFIRSTNKSLKISNTVKIQYEKDVVYGYKFRAGAALSDEKVILETMITNSDGYGIGIEFIASLFPLKLDAAECGCEVEYFTVDVINEMSYRSLISIPLEIKNENKGVCNAINEIGTGLVETMVGLRKYLIGPSSIEIEEKRIRQRKWKRIKERREEVQGKIKELRQKKLKEEIRKWEKEYELKKAIMETVAEPEKIRTCRSKQRVKEKEDEVVYAPLRRRRNCEDSQCALKTEIYF